MDYGGYDPQGNDQMYHTGYPEIQYEERLAICPPPANQNFQRNPSFSGNRNGNPHGNSHGNPHGNPQVRNVYSEDQSSGRNIFVYLKVETQTYRALLDTGSQINLVTRSIVEGKDRSVKEGMCIRGINGKSMTHGSVMIRFFLGLNEMEDLFHIVDDSSLGNFDLYLGSQFFVKNKCIMDYEKLSISNRSFSDPMHIECIQFKLQYDLQNTDRKGLLSVVHNVFIEENKENNFPTVAKAVKEGVKESDKRCDFSMKMLSIFKLNHLCFVSIC